MSVIDIIIEGSLEVKLRQYGQMKSIDGKSQRREEKRRGKEKRREEEKKRDDQRRERVRRKKMQVRER